MKAAVARAFGTPLRIEDVTLQPPGADAIRVRIAACAICQSDVHSIDGAWQGPLPAVYGHEAAGTVAEIGDGVTEFAVGDHVVVTLVRHCGHCQSCARDEVTFCTTRTPLDEVSPIADSAGHALFQGLRTGGFAEYVVVHSSQAVRIPETLPLDAAALLACGVLTGFGAVVNTLDVQTDETVAVFGTGGVGINSIQAAAINGARVVIAIDTSESKLQLAKALGATHTINPLHQDPDTEVKAIVGPTGVDHAVTSVVTSPVLNSAISLTRSGGAVGIVGMAPEGITAEINPTDIANRGIRICGSKMGGSQPSIDIPNLVDLYQQGRLKLDELITGRYPLAEINTALDDCRTGAAVRNVILP